MLFAHARSVDVSGGVERQGGDFFLGRAVENEGFAIGRNAVHQAAAVRAGNQVALGIERQHADVGLVAGEKDRVLPFGGDPKDLAVIAGGDVKIAGIIEGEVPNILGRRIEIDRRIPCGGGRSLACRRIFARPHPRRRFDLVHLAVRIGGGIEPTVFVDDQSLYLQFLGLENRASIGLPG